MRTRLHEHPLGRPKGHWQAAPAPVNWRARIALLIVAFVGINVLAVVAPKGTSVLGPVTATAAPGYTCVERDNTYTLRQAITTIVIGRATFRARGCYWNDHAGVKSLSFTVDGYANAPYHWAGVIGTWQSGEACGTWSNCDPNRDHIKIRGKRVSWEFCAVGSVGCTSVGTAAKEAVMDAYGNLAIRDA